LGLSWTDAISVVLSAIGVYLAFLILIRIVGQRALAAMSSFDFAATIAVGAIMGRAVLGYTPTLGAGVLGMATLFALQSAFGRVRWNRRLDRALSTVPLLLVANGAVLPDNLRKVKISEGEVRQQQLPLPSSQRADSRWAPGEWASKAGWVALSASLRQPADYGIGVAFSLTTERLRIRDWTVDDADAALATYGVAEVTGWLTPETDRIGDRQAMRSVLQAWV